MTAVQTNMYTLYQHVPYIEQMNYQFEWLDIWLLCLTILGKKFDSIGLSNNKKHRNLQTIIGNDSYWSQII